MFPLPSKKKKNSVTQHKCLPLCATSYIFVVVGKGAASSFDCDKEHLRETQWPDQTKHSANQIHLEDFFCLAFIVFLFCFHLHQLREK